MVAGYVELLAGTPYDIEEVHEASSRANFQSRQRRVTESTPAAPGAVVVEEPACVVAQEPDAPADVEPAPPLVGEPVRPRRREPPTVVQAATAVEEEGELAGVEVEPAGVEENGNGLLVQK